MTTSDEHPAKAFELDALDYLVKPFNSKRLAQKVQKVLRALPSTTLESKPKHHKSSSGTGSHAQSAREGSFQEAGRRKGQGVLLISLNEVRYIVAHNDRVTVYTVDEQYPCRFSLTRLDTRLVPQGFVRVHRSYLVNLQHI